MLEQNNRSYLTIAIGCTGKHRSVYIAQQIGEYFQAKGKNVKIQHKSLEKNKRINQTIKNAATCCVFVKPHIAQKSRANVQLMFLFLPRFHAAKLAIAHLA